MGSRGFLSKYVATAICVRPSSVTETVSVTAAGRASSFRSIVACAILLQRAQEPLPASLIRNHRMERKPMMPAMESTPKKDDGTDNVAVEAAAIDRSTEMNHAVAAAVADVVEEAISKEAENCLGSSRPCSLLEEGEYAPLDDAKNQSNSSSESMINEDDPVDEEEDEMMQAAAQFVRTDLGPDGPCPKKRARHGDARVPWKDRISTLQAYKEQHGHLNIPIRYKANPSLGKFVHNTREQFKLFHGKVKKGYQKRCSLTAERIAELDAIGFLWTTERVKRQNEDWAGRLEQLKEYKSQHGVRS